MRWACVLLPHLALDGRLRQVPETPLPTVLIDGPSQRRIVHDACGRGRALGLRRGQSLATAQAFAGQLRLLAHDAQDEARQLDLLAAWAYGYSSQVARIGPRALVVEVGGSEGLFGPWPSLQSHWREELAAMGFRHRLALTPHPLAARVLAGSEDGASIDCVADMGARLNRLAVHRIGLPAATADALARMGLRTLGQLRALPRASLARRFSPELLAHLDALYGERDGPLTLYRPPDRFQARIELGFEVESSQALLFPLRRLTADLALYLIARDGGVQCFDLLLEHERHPPSRVPVGLLAPEREATRLFDLARGRLERAELPAAVCAIGLSAQDLPAFVPEHRDLFDTRAQQSLPWLALRERLRARLGEDAVQTLSAPADHRPERATHSAVDPPAAPVTITPPRPGWLLSEPRLLPHALAQTLTDPERIESGWWDGADIRRDYYRVRTRSGQHAWAFHPHDGDGRLWLHGWFA
ncbi:MAG: DNA polymerase Y family protein [Lysobacteraceae bacterium]